MNIGTDNPRQSPLTLCLSFLRKLKTLVFAKENSHLKRSNALDAIEYLQIGVPETFEKNEPLDS